MSRLAGRLAALAVLAAAAPLAAAELAVNAAAAAVGVFGLDVTVGSTCTAADEVTLEAPPASVGGDFEACRTLTASGVVVTTAAAFVAGETIALGNGFAVAAGASFSASIDGLMPERLVAVTTRSPIAERTFNARFHLRLDQLALADGEELDHLQAVAADGAEIFRLIVRRQSGQNLLVLGARQDGGGEILTAAGQEAALAAGWNLVELAWRAGGGDGQLLLSVNQGASAGLTDLDNGLAEIDRLRWGAVDGVFAGSPGRLEVDGFSSWR